MIRIYQAANLPQAHLLAGLLRHANIAVRVFNENAQGGLGELPFSEVYPEVWIEDAADLSKANAIIKHFEDAPVETGSVFCRACNEENPSNFELCWKCGERF